MEDKRHPRIKDLPFEVPENLDPDAFLFLGDPGGQTRTLIGRWWLCASGALILGGGTVLTNIVAKRPAISALHKTVFWSVLGGVLGEWSHNYKERYIAERDLQFFHYMCLHPEDFPKPKKVLFRDYLAPWYPIR